MSASLANIAVTMSSREIAELTGKNHQHVRRDIEKMLADLSLNEKGYVQTWTHPQNGREYEEYALPKNLTMNLITGYRADLRLKVIDRLMELEATPTSPTVPTSFREALLLAASQQEEIERQKALIDETAPKAAALDRISLADGSYGLTQAAKILQVGPKALNTFLAMHKWIYRFNNNKHWLAYEDKRSSGLLRHKLDTYTDQSTGEEKARDTVRVTVKGIIKLAKIVPGAKIDPEYAHLMENQSRPFAKRPEPAS